MPLITCLLGSRSIFMSRSTKLITWRDLLMPFALIAWLWWIRTINPTSSESSHRTWATMSSPRSWTRSYSLLADITKCTEGWMSSLIVSLSFTRLQTSMLANTQFASQLLIQVCAIGLHCLRYNDNKGKGSVDINGPKSVVKGE